MTTDATLRDIVYAPPPGRGYSLPQLPAKAPHTRRPYEIDFAPLLRQLGQDAIASGAVLADAPLEVDGWSTADAVAAFHVRGGAVGPAGGSASRCCSRTARARTLCWPSPW